MGYREVPALSDSGLIVRFSSGLTGLKPHVRLSLMDTSRHLRSNACILVGVLMVTLSTFGTADQAPRSPPKYAPKPTDFAIVCTLSNGPPKGAKVELPDLPITYDAHFVTGAHVDRLEFGKSPWPVGTSLNFVVHSPTRLFGARFSEEQFVLTFSPFRPTMREDKIWFSPETQYLLQAIERVRPKSGRSGIEHALPADAVRPIMKRRG
jgi:hypothetical protein